MKSTGVTRKIDELGRIVIPKEIRRNLGIRDGEVLEINIDDDNIILKKHSVIKKLEDLSKKLTELISSIYKVNVIITDREKVIASSLSENILNVAIDSNLINLIDYREVMIKKEIYTIKFGDQTVNGFITIVPIIASIDSLGLVIIVSDDYRDLTNLAKLVSNIIADSIVI